MNCSEIQGLASSYFIQCLFAFSCASPRLILRLYYVLVYGDDQPSELTTCITGLFLKDYLQTKLDNAWVTRTHHLAEMDGIEQESRADLVKVGVIQYIGGLNAELHIHPLIYVSVFE